MQVEQTLYRIGPVQTAFARGEERVGVPDGMNDNVGGFEGILDPLCNDNYFSPARGLIVAGGSASKRDRALR